MNNDQKDEQNAYDLRLLEYSKLFEEKGYALHDTEPLVYELAVLSNGRKIALSEKSVELVARFDKYIKELEEYKSSGKAKIDEHVKMIMRDAFDGVGIRLREAAHSAKLIVDDE